MTHFKAALLSALLALGLASCGSSPVTEPVPGPPPAPTPAPPPTPVPAPSPDHVPVRTLNFGDQNDLRVTLPFTGEWTVTRTPSWVRYVKNAGGTLDLSFQAVRANVDFQAMAQNGVKGEVVITWKTADGRGSGQTAWPVSLNMYEVTGTLAPLQASGADALPGRVEPARLQSQGLSDGYIVTYKTQRGRDLAQQALERLKRQSLQAQGGLPAAQLDPLGAARLVIRHASPDLLSALRQDTNVQSVTPNAALLLQSTPDSAAPRLSALGLTAPLEPGDQYVANQWAWRMLGYPAVWRDMQQNPYQTAVVVAVLDTGVRYDHPDLAGALLRGTQGALDLVPRERSDDDNGTDSDPTDPTFLGRTSGSHGTHVTGIIAARWGTFAAPCDGCSVSGVAGAAYTAPVKVLPIRIMDSSGRTNIAETVNGIRYAAGLPITVDGNTLTNPTPARVLNLSLGSQMSAETAAPLCEAISEVRRKDVLVVAASGNFGTTTPVYPAACADAVAVGAVTPSLSGAPQHSTFSSAFPQVTLSAPGGAGDPKSVLNGSLLNGQPFPDDIMSTNWDYSRDLPNYSGASGTSQAAPQVTALAALLLSKSVTHSAESTLERLIQTATDLGQGGRDDQFGYGMINPAAALKTAAISDGQGLQLYADNGRTYALRRTLNTFTAYLPEGQYRLVYGTDLNGNSTYGENGETSIVRPFSLNLNSPRVNLGELGR